MSQLQNQSVQTLQVEYNELLAQLDSQDRRKMQPLTIDVTPQRFRCSMPNESNTIQQLLSQNLLNTERISRPQQFIPLKQSNGDHITNFYYLWRQMQQPKPKVRTVIRQQKSNHLNPEQAQVLTDLLKREKHTTKQFYSPRYEGNSQQHAIKFKSQPMEVRRQQHRKKWEDYQKNFIIQLPQCTNTTLKPRKLVGGGSFFDKISNRNLSVQGVTTRSLRNSPMRNK